MIDDNHSEDISSKTAQGIGAGLMVRVDDLSLLGQWGQEEALIRVDP